MEKEIIDFPDYTIDTDTGDVFSYRSGKRKLLKAYERVGGPSYSLYNYDAGTWLTVSLARLIASVTFNVSYSKLNKNIIFTWSQEYGLIAKDRYEHARAIAKAHYKHKNKQPIEVIDRVIGELMLLRKAYQGDRTELITYLYNNRSRYLRKFCMSHTSRGVNTNDIVDTAIQRVIDNTFQPFSSVINIDSFIYYTCMNIARNKRVRTTPYNDDILYK